MASTTIHNAMYLALEHDPMALRYMTRYTIIMNLYVFSSDLVSWATAPSFLAPLLMF